MCLSDPHTKHGVGPVPTFRFGEKFGIVFFIWGLVYDVLLGILLLGLDFTNVFLWNWLFDDVLEVLLLETLKEFSFPSR